MIFGCATGARSVILCQRLHGISTHLVEVALGVASGVGIMSDTLQGIGRLNHSRASFFGMTELILKFFLQGFGWADLPEGYLKACFSCKLANLVFETGYTSHEGLRLKLVAIWFPLSQSLCTKISLTIKDILRC